MESIIDTGQGDGIKLCQIIDGEMCIQLGMYNRYDGFQTLASDVINKEQAIQIISHLQKEFSI